MASPGLETNSVFGFSVEHFSAVLLFAPDYAGDACFLLAHSKNAGGGQSSVVESMLSEHAPGPGFNPPGPPFKNKEKKRQERKGHLHSHLAAISAVHTLTLPVFSPLSEYRGCPSPVKGWDCRSPRFCGCE